MKEDKNLNKTSNGLEGVNLEPKNLPSLINFLPKDIDYPAFKNVDGVDIPTEKFLSDILSSAVEIVYDMHSFYIPKFTLDEVLITQENYCGIDEIIVENIEIYDVIKFLNSPYNSHLVNFIKDSKTFGNESIPIINAILEYIMDISNVDIINLVHKNMLSSKKESMDNVSYKFKTIEKFIKNATQFIEINKDLKYIVNKINRYIFDEYNHIISSYYEIENSNNLIISKLIYVTDEFISKDIFDFFGEELGQELKERFKLLNDYLLTLKEGVSETNMKQQIALNIAERLVSNNTFNCLEINDGFIITNLNSVVYDGFLKNKSILELNLILKSIEFSFRSNTFETRTKYVLKTLIENYPNIYSFSGEKINLNELKFREVRLNSSTDLVGSKHLQTLNKFRVREVKKN